MTVRQANGWIDMQFELDIQIFSNESNLGESECPLEISAMICELTNIVFSSHEMPFYKKKHKRSKQNIKDKKIEAVRDFFQILMDLPFRKL